MKSDKISFFVTDNASNNDTAIDIVVAHYFPNMPHKTRISRRLRCLGHVINLTAKAFLYSNEFDTFKKGIKHVKEHSELLKELNLWRKRGPISKLYNVLIFIY